MKLSQFIVISLLEGCALWLAAGAVNPKQVPATALLKNQTVVLSVNSNRPPLRTNFWVSATPKQMETNASICQQFVRDHRWIKTASFIHLDTNPTNGSCQINYCTNCGVLRIEVSQ